MMQSEQLNVIDHLEELRSHVVIVLVTVSAASVISFFLSDWLLNLITAPIMKTVDLLYFYSPHEAFMTKIKLSVAAGITLSLPVIFYQLWKFVSPGLYPSEKKKIIPLVSISTGLFLFGILFAYFAVVPFALNFFLDFQNEVLQPLISIGSYLAFFLSLTLVFGLLFELPVILVGLIALGVLKTEFLKAQRKVAIIVIVILAAVLTPTVDLVTQLLLALPLWLLFELSIWLGDRIQKRMKS